MTAFFKLAYSIGFLFNPKGALPRDFFQQVKTISNQATAARIRCLTAQGRKAQQSPTQLTPGFTLVLCRGWDALEKQSKVKLPSVCLFPL